MPSSSSYRRHALKLLRDLNPPPPTLSAKKETKETEDKEDGLTTEEKKNEVKRTKEETVANK